MSAAADLFIRIGADTSDIKNALTGVAGQLQGFGSQATNMGKKLSVGLTAPLTALAGTLVGLATSTAAYGDQVAKTAEKLGVSAQAFQEMEYWASQNGVATNDLERAVGRLNQRIGMAAEGSDKYSDAFAALGVQIHGTSGEIRATEDVMQDTISALQGIEDPAARSAAAAEVFGTKLARELMPALRDSAMGMQEAAEEANALGFVFHQTAQAEEFMDALDRMKRSFQALGREIGAELIPIFLDTLFPIIEQQIIPALRELAGQLAAVVEWFANLPEPVQAFVIAIGTIAAAAGPALIVIGKISTGLSAIMPIVTPLIAGLKVLAGIVAGVFTGAAAPFVIAGAIIVGLGVIIYTFRDEIMGAFETAFNFVRDAVGGFVADLSARWDEMLEALSPVIEAMTGVLHWFVDQYDWFKQTISDGIAAVVAFFDDIWQGFLNTLDTIQALVEDGVKAILSPFTWLRDQLSGTLEKAKEYLDWLNPFARHSPSLVDNVEAGTKIIGDAYTDVAATASSAMSEMSNAKTQFEEAWADKVFRSTATRLELLENEKEEAIAKAEELGASTVDIVDHFEREKNQIIADSLRERTSFEESYTQKLFDLTATRAEALDQEYMEAMQQAERLGADTTAVREYYTQRINELAEQEAEARTKDIEQANDERLKLEQSFTDKLFQLTSSRQEILEREYDEAVAHAREIGADLYSVREYYEHRLNDLAQEMAEERRKEIEGEDQARLDFEQGWTDRLFRASASRLEILEYEKNEAIAKATEMGASTVDIVEYYENERTKIASEHAEARESFEANWNSRLTQLTASREEILRSEYSAALAEAQSLGADTYAVREYYEQQITSAIQEENQKRLDEIKEADNARLTFEQAWTDRLFQATADRGAILEREKEHALEQARELGADTAAIIEYYENERTNITREAADRRMEFEAGWIDTLRQMQSSKEDLLQHEYANAISEAERLGADTYAIHEVFEERLNELREEKAKERADQLQEEVNARTSFEESWTQKVFQSSASRLEILAAEQDEALSQARQLGANTLDIFTYFEQQKAKVLQEEIDKRLDLESQWSDKLFRLTASRIEILQTEADEAIAEAERLGASTVDIKEYYRQRIAEVEEEELQARNEEIKAQNDARLDFEEKYNRQLFELTSTRKELLLQEYAEAMEIAASLGADTYAVRAVFEKRLTALQDEESQKRHERLDEEAKARLDFEQGWADKVFQQSASRLEILEREKNEAITKAEEMGADITDIVAYFENERTKLVREGAAARLAFEEQWINKVFELSATQEELLERDYTVAIAEAQRLGADTYAIEAYYADRRQELRDEESKRQEEQAQEAADARLAFERDYNRKLFEQVTEREDILQRDMQEALDVAAELGADTYAVRRYYENLITEMQDEEAKKRQNQIQEESDARLELETQWNQKLFQLTATREEILLDEQSMAIEAAEAIGADTYAIRSYYEQRISELYEEEAKKRQDEINAANDSRLKVEQDWSNKLFQITASREEQLTDELEKALANAREHGADTADIYEYFEIRKTQALQEELDTRLSYEQAWADKLFQLTGSRTDILQAEADEAIAEAERLGADTLAIREYYQQRISAIEEEERSKRLDLEQEWAGKLFAASATRLEILEKEEQEALARAESMGASTVDIVAYFENERTKLVQEGVEQRIKFEEDWQQKLFELHADDEQRLQREYDLAVSEAERLGADTLAIHTYYADRIQQVRDNNEKERADEAKQIMDTRLAFEEQFSRRLFEHSATRVELLEREMQENLSTAAELGADTYEIRKLYETLITEAIEEEIKERSSKLEAFEQGWSDKLFALVNDREAVLRKELEEALSTATELGADTYAIRKYYEERISAVQAEEAKKRQDEIDAEADARLSFEESYTRQLFEHSATRMELLERDLSEALALAEELGADTYAVRELFERRITDMIAEEQQTRLDFEKGFARQLFEQTATRQELLEQELQENLSRAEELGADTYAIRALHEMRITAMIEEEIQARTDFEVAWNRKLYELNATRVELLQDEMQSAINDAEELGADTYAIRSYYEQRITEVQAEESKKRQDDIDAEAKTRLDFEQQFTERLFQETASRREILDRELEQNLARAEELGADTYAIRALHERRVTEMVREETEARETFDADISRQMFERSATRLELVDREMRETLAIAEELGADIYAVRELYEMRITDIVEEETQKRLDFEESWNRKLFELNADRVTSITREMEETLAVAEELGADTYAIRSYYEQRISEVQAEEAKKRQDDIDAEAKTRLDFEEGYTRQLFERTATRQELLQRDLEESLAKAEELGADTYAIRELYELKLTDLVKEESQTRLDFEESFSNKLFEQSASRLDMVEREFEQTLATAERIGADTYEVRRYFEQKISDILAEETKTRMDFEDAWADRVWQATASRLDLLEREKNNAIRLAEEQGASTENIVAYYEMRKTELTQEGIRDRESFEQQWADKLFQLTATRTEILEQEYLHALQTAEALGAETSAIREYYEIQITNAQMRETEARMSLREQEVDHAVQSASVIAEAQAMITGRSIERQDSFGPSWTGGGTVNLDQTRQLWEQIGSYLRVPSSQMGRGGKGFVSDVWATGDVAEAAKRAEELRAVVEPAAPTDTGRFDARTEHVHRGVIEVHGINQDGELLGVVDIIMDKLRQEVRL